MDMLRDLNEHQIRRKAVGEIADYIMQVGLKEPNRDPRFMKAAVTAHQSGDVSALTEPFQPFADIVTAITILGKIRGLTVDSPPYLPIPTVIDEPDVTWVGEGSPIPFAKVSTATARTLPTKYATLWAATKELFRIGDGRARTLLVRVSTRQLARAEDRKFLSADAAGSDSPAGILNGLSASGSGSPDDLQVSLEELYADVVDGRAENPVFVTSGRGALYLANSGSQAFKDVKLKGGTILGVPQLVSPGAGDNLILLDASELAHVDSGLEVATSEQASVQFLDNPTTNSASGTAVNLVSAWQSNTVVVKFVRYVYWTKLRVDAAGFVELPIGGSPS